jgi:hypothetical protein
MNNNFITKWRIVEMELWDQDFVDAEFQGYIDFHEGGMGEFQFGYVHGFIDCRYSDENGHSIVNFSWVGNDDGQVKSTTLVKNKGNIKIEEI